MSTLDTTAPSQLRSYIERVERLEEEIAGLNSDKKDLFAEAKSNGFDVKALKSVLGIRRKEPTERAEHNALVALYLSALGMADAAAEVEANDPVVQVQAPARSEARANATDETRPDEGGRGEAQDAVASRKAVPAKAGPGDAGETRASGPAAQDPEPLDYVEVA